jgi:hypothetical protein
MEVFRLLHKRAAWRTSTGGGRPLDRTSLVMVPSDGVLGTQESDPADATIARSDARHMRRRRRRRRKGHDFTVLLTTPSRNSGQCPDVTTVAQYMVHLSIKWICTSL